MMKIPHAVTTLLHSSDSANSTEIISKSDAGFRGIRLEPTTGHATYLNKVIFSIVHLLQRNKNFETSVQPKSFTPTLYLMS